MNLRLGMDQSSGDGLGHVASSKLRMMARLEVCGESAFAARVLQDLLRHIAIQNVKNSFQVSHAWTTGPMMYLVYRTPPSDITWGLARDTTSSLIDPGPWTEADDPALYYYLLDLEEGWPGNSSLQPGDDPEVIRWSGWPLEDLTERIGDIPESYRHVPVTFPVVEAQSQPSSATEPRRYGNPL